MEAPMEFYPLVLWQPPTLLNFTYSPQYDHYLEKEKSPLRLWRFKSHFGRITWNSVPNRKPQLKKTSMLEYLENRKLPFLWVKKAHCIFSLGAKARVANLSELSRENWIGAIDASQKFAMGSNFLFIPLAQSRLMNRMKKNRVLQNFEVCNKMSHSVHWIYSQSMLLCWSLKQWNLLQ